jgi:regulator of protease activity HflC (stomatin/prohibitin superfamily)
VALFVSSKIKRGMEGFGEAVNGLALLGLVGTVAMGASVLLSWMGTVYAAEIGGGVLAFLMALQGLELGVNATRSYAGVEEFDQEPVDLQATPLIPMLSSIWINGIQMLGGQMIGLGGAKSERGVLARMLPRVVAAAVVLGILVSMVRVVPAGHVAVVERFGQVVGMDPAQPNSEAINANLLRPGMHFLLPWPIDNIVLISNERVRSVDVGAELKPTASVMGTGFEFWNVPHVKDTSEGRFVTGDMNKAGQADPQLLESFATVYWRVKDPGKFYLALSHSEYFGKETGDSADRKPIFEAIVQRVAEEAMTSSFAQNSAEQIMLAKRQTIEDTAKKVMQGHLDEKGLDCGIEIVQFTINDVHPPYGQPNESQDIRGPAGAFEEVVKAMQDRSGSISVGRAVARITVLKEKGDGDVKVLEAQQYFDTRKNGAAETAARMAGSANGYRDFPFAAKARLLYEMGEALRPVQKIILGPGVRAPNVWQEPKEGALGGKGPGG